MILFLVLFVSIVLSSSDAQDCGNTDFFENYGYISSPNYPNDYDNDLQCVYSIYSSGTDSSFTLIFQDFMVEEYFDYLEISCSTDDTFAPITYTGYTLPPPTSVPSCGQAEVYFFTDHTITYGGFLLEYQISTGGCGNTVYNESGSLSSPGYPGEYGTNQNCSYILWAEYASQFQLTFNDFELEDCAGCTCDWVDIRCQDDNTDYGRFCGTTVQQEITIDSCSQVLVWFSSNGDAVYAGFQLDYTIT